MPTRTPSSHSLQIAMSHKRNAREQLVGRTGTDIELEIATSLRQPTSTCADDALYTRTAEIADPTEQAIDPSGMEHAKRSKLRTATVMIALCVSVFSPGSHIL